MDIADRNGDDFRRLLLSAERFNERAIFFALPLKTRLSRSSALLCSVTSRDHRRGTFFARRRTVWAMIGKAEDAVRQGKLWR